MLSCFRKDDQPYQPVSSELRKYFDYKPGTYWVYKDSATGSFDSVSVYLNMGNNTDPHIEQIRIGLKLYYGQGGKTDTFNYDLLENKIFMDYDPGLTGIYASSYLLTYVPFVFPQQNNGINGGAPNIPDLVQLIPEMVIDGNHFNNVLEVHAQRNDAYLKYDDWLYVSKGQGIVKMRLNHPGASLTRTYELKKWNLIL